MKLLKEILFMVKILLFTYLVSIVMVMIFSAIALRNDYSGEITCIVLIAIYFLSNFLGTVVVVKAKHNKRIIRATALSCLYLGGLIIASLILKQSDIQGINIAVAAVSSFLGSVLSAIVTK